MARVEITFGTLGNRTEEGSSAVLFKGDTMATEVLTSGATSQASTTASAARNGFGFVEIRADAPVWIVAGASPVAIVPAPGQVRPGIRVDPTSGGVGIAVANSHKIAVINI